VVPATFHLPSKRDCRALARPRKRHYTFARRHRDQFATVRVRRHPKPKALICREYLFATKARSRDRAGRGKAADLAPFVYRLGRHPFTVERAVRFR
jgi:hypothetical protein